MNALNERSQIRSLMNRLRAERVQAAHTARELQEQLGAEDSRTRAAVRRVKQIDLVGRSVAALLS